MNFDELRQRAAAVQAVPLETVSLFRGAVRDGEFRTDALAYVGLAGHAKAEKAFQLAWDLAVSYHGPESHYRALIQLKSLADLLLSD